MEKKSNVDIGIGVNLLDVVEGQVLRLKNGQTGKVTENMGDGQWVELRCDGEDEPRLVHSQDIDAVV